MRQINDEHGESFHQEKQELKNRYLGRITENMSTKTYWFLQRESNTMCKQQAKRSKHLQWLTRQQLVCVFRAIAVTIIVLKLKKILPLFINCVFIHNKRFVLLYILSVP